MFESSAVQNTLHILAEEKVFSVSELSSAVRGAIEKQFNTPIKIRGEVSGLKRHSSGHTYLSLKDNDAVIKAVFWRGTKLQINLEDGMEIVAKGKITTYPSSSQYQLIISEASLAGEGALLKLLNERKKLFASLGYFSKKRRLPKYPKTIGIVTSPTGAVLQDMRHRLEDRYPFCEVYVWPVNVQGTLAAEQVSNAIRGFNFMTEKRPDIIIVARGGGSIEDLWPFNEESVVKAVFDSAIPVISAIGHETDFTLIDYAADLRAPTPTAAIELATPVLSEVSVQIEEYAFRMKQSIARILKDYAQRILIAQKSMASSQFAIMNIIQKFDDRSEKFLFSCRCYIQNLVANLNSRKLLSLENYVELKNQQYNSRSVLFEKLLNCYINKYSDKLEVLKNRLDQSSYRKILEKGFCFITSKEGDCIQTVEQFETERENGLSIHFQDGSTSL